MNTRTALTFVVLASFLYTPSHGICAFLRRRPTPARQARHDVINFIGFASTCVLTIWVMYKARQSDKQKERVKRTHHT